MKPGSSPTAAADRQSCPNCGETVPLATAACPFCKASLLVDVALAAPVDDERIRYQLARAIASLGPPAPGFSTAQRALADPRPVLARGISRLAARHLLESLADFGLSGTAEPAGTVAPRSASGGRRLAMAATWAALGAVTIAGAFLATRHVAPSVHRGAAPSHAGLAQTRSIPWSSPSPSLSLKDLSALAAPATVEVRCGDRRSTGFFGARDLVLTLAQVTEGCPAVEIVSAGRGTLRGQVTAQDARLGVTLIRVTGSGAEPLRLGDASSLHSGERVAILGGLGPGGPALREARMGTIARKFGGVAYLALEGDIQPGDAGGPVMDEHGYVVGVVAAMEKTGGEPFLLPINYTYDESHLLERPSPGPNLKRWKALLAEAELAEKLRVEPTPDSGTPPLQPSQPSPSIQ
ncbi:MAG: trypsin-like peptidase domain-containing protein [Acidobacteria bacterium]|nr:trypsin-like peptidase domain-containing protein [Acidobacteriota bacterium]